MGRRPPRKSEVVQRLAVIYARVSSKEQEREGFSIPAQLKLLQHHAAELGLQVLREFVDVETAKAAGRSAFGEMLNFLHKNPKCRAILVEKTDRLYRNLRDWVTLDDVEDLEIHFVKEGAVVSEGSRSSEKFVHGIKVLMAKQYVDNLSEETRKGMAEKASQGIWPSQAPIGYRNVLGPDGKRIIVPEPVEADLVRQAFRWYASGTYSLVELTTMARAAGLSYRKSGAPIPKSVIHKMLTNSIYKGELVWKGQRYRGTHDPLVSPELFDQVQGVMNRHAQGRKPKAPQHLPFVGMVRCGNCGRHLTGEVKRGGLTYYHCTGRQETGCREAYTREEVLERELGKMLRQISIEGPVLEWIRRALRESNADQVRFHKETIERLQREHSKVQERLERAYVDRLDGRISLEMYERLASKWRAEQDATQLELDRHRTANRSYVDEGIRLLELASRAHELFERRSAVEKRRLLDFLVSNTTWRDGHVEAEWKQPFDLIASATTAEKIKKAAGCSSDSLSEIWLPFTDGYRTLCLMPPESLRSRLEDQLPLSA